MSSIEKKRATMTSSPFAFDSVSYEGKGKKGKITLTGHAEPGARIRLFEGNSEIGEADADDEGVWSFAKKGAVRSGMHLFRAGYILKNGRMAAEVRMQYDHDGEIKVVGIDPDNRQMAGNRVGDNAVIAKGASARKARATKSKRVRRRKARRGTRVARRKGSSLRSRKSARRIKRARRSARLSRQRSKSRAKRSRVRRYNKTDRRYYLKGRNKSKYLAKRKLYPRKRATPAKVRVRHGTTLWGYSEHYYGKGRYYKRIYRANKRRIGKNPHLLRPGVKIRVPKIRKKRRKRKLRR